MTDCNTYGMETIRLYTLEDAEKILNRRKRIILNKKKKVILYFLKQKACGLISIAGGIGSIIILDGDMTFALIALTLGIGLLVTRHEEMEFRK